MSAPIVQEKALHDDTTEHADPAHPPEKPQNKGVIGHVLASGIHNVSSEDRAAALNAAREVDSGPRFGSLASVSFVFTMVIACMCSGDNGFDGTVMSSVYSMTTFRSFYNVSLTGGVDIIFGIYTVGSVCAFFGSATLPDLIGRRRTMFTGNLLLITGALIAGLAHSKGMLLGGRFLTGFGSGIANTASKAFVVEMASATNRGRWVGLLNSWYYIGQILATGISIPFGRDHVHSRSWRAPILIQIVPAAINVIFILFCRESPRWDYTRGNRERAIKTLAYFHSETKDEQSPIVRLEIQEIEEHISLTGSDKRWYDFSQLFVNRQSASRFGLTIIISVWGQLSGNGLITYYLPTLLDQAGITSGDRQRVLNLANSVTSMTGAMTGTLVVDHVGRRPLLLFSSFSCCIGMAIVAGLLSPAGPQSVTRANAGVTFIFLFMVFFSFGWTPLQALYPAEVLPFQNRAKGLALQGWATSAVSCINTFGLPEALGHLRWKTYLIFMAWDIVGIVCIWLFIVETKQLTLEELDDVFESTNPRQKSNALFRQAKARAKAEKAGVPYVDDHDV